MNTYMNKLKVLYAPCTKFPYFPHILGSFLIAEALFWGHLYIFSRNVEHVLISLMAQGGGFLCLYVIWNKNSKSRTDS